MGLRPGLITAVALMCLMDVFSYSIMVVILPKTLPTLSPITHSSCLTIRQLVALLACPLGGILVDNTSFWFGMVVSSLCYVVACSLLLVEDSLNIYFASRVIQGFASSLFYPAALNGIVSTHDDSSRGRAIGLAFLGEVGGLAGLAVGGFLYDYGGSKLAWFFNLIISLYAFLVVVGLGWLGLPGPNPSHFIVQRTAGAASAAAQGSLGRPLTSSEEPSTDAHGGAAPYKVGGLLLLGHPVFFTILLSLAFAWMGGSAICALLPLLWSDTYHMSASRIGGLFLPLLILKAISGPLAGLLIDRCGVRPLLLIGVMVLWCAGTLVWLGSTLGAAALSVYGVPFGALDTITTAAAGQWMDEQVVVRGEGKAFAIMGQFFNLGLLVGPAMAASLIQEAHFSYSLAFQTVGILFVPLAVAAFVCHWGTAKPCSNRVIASAHDRHILPS
ncbi:unnamed protein product [Vitrella brassicaformis CCMP3155]|uniref:Major facilitator superfamily (MFS) profile domain-containing protein n=1 Tax=Vitrella brassicaformis (strain CCMP3155) TaxID=1169540 RepID=A0A0G4G9D4_VITBC|nr:unnamed protein product [Vitrella brassicaformis CCMP3155]|mmetsp:Transcript_3736/g.9326  ORF Transcript_3736/g.9326 Transcript_3736/m.9326 type:complete len:443 (-) Transcript_3736:2244-3572(-)|eukprot:CEM25184.1 unnamed protein product [Vitrella brassicaformis CCMP3155]